MDPLEFNAMNQRECDNWRQKKHVFKALYRVQNICSFSQVIGRGKVIINRSQCKI